MRDGGGGRVALYQAFGLPRAVRRLLPPNCIGSQCEVLPTGFSAQKNADCPRVSYLEPA